MKFITVSELRLKAPSLVREVEKSKDEMVITRNGKPVALLSFFTGVDLKPSQKGEPGHASKRGL